MNGKNAHKMDLHELKNDVEEVDQKGEHHGHFQRPPIPSPVHQNIVVQCKNLIIDSAQDDKEKMCVHLGHEQE